MAFILQNWGEVSKTANTSIVYNDDGTPQTVFSSPSVFSYFSSDTVAQTSADDYFSQIVMGVKPGDLIYASCYDGEVLLIIRLLNVYTKEITTSELLNPSEPPIFTNRVNLNPSDVITLRDTPFVLVPAVPGKIIVPLNMVFQFRFNGTQYTVNTAEPSGIYYDITQNPIVNSIDQMRAFIESVNSTFMIVTPDNNATLVMGTASATGNSLKLLNTGLGNYGGGNGQFSVTTSYVLITGEA